MTDMYQSYLNSLNLKIRDVESLLKEEETNTALILKLQNLLLLKDFYIQKSYFSQKKEKPVIDF